MQCRFGSSSLLLVLFFIAVYSSQTSLPSLKFKLAFDQDKSLLAQDSSIEVFDFFPNWQNLLPTAKLQMIGHDLLSTNFNRDMAQLSARGPKSGNTTLKLEIS